ncbi:MAG TPA: hypothetical protein VGM81_00300 [Burkholderiaceae bacterium]|jgi:hypothetical protein
MKYALPLIVLLTLNFNGSASAAEPRSAQVYHCGPQGRDLRDSPCPDAPDKAASSIAYSEPTAAEQSAARERASADADQATAMEQQRRINEAQARRDNARGANLSASAASQPSESQIVHVRPAQKFKPIKKPHPPKAANAAPH